MKVKFREQNYDCLRVISAFADFSLDCSIKKLD